MEFQSSNLLDKSPIAEARRA